MRLIVVIQEVLLADCLIHFEIFMKEYLQLVSWKTLYEDMVLEKFYSIVANTLKKHLPDEILSPNLKSIIYSLIGPKEK